MSTQTVTITKQTQEEVHMTDHIGADPKIGADGSGAIAIKMIHTDSTFTMIADVIRLIFSICLLIFSTISVFYAISTSTTTLPTEAFPVWSQYVCLIISLFVLGVLEGLQISVVELAHKDPNRYRKNHSRAANLLEFENRGRNVERFLMGRQVLVVFTVFVAARITTFNGFFADVPDTLIHSLMFSGFLGVILVVVLAQLTPQVLAAAYPVEFMNLPGLKYFFYACLFVEASGLVHAVWFLCATVRSIVYNCLCSYVEKERLESHSKMSMSHNMNNIPKTSDIITSDMAVTAHQIAKTIDNNYYSTEYTASCDQINNKMEHLIQQFGANKDLFYIYGNGKYMSPSQCYDKFRNAGLTPPAFLLSPDNVDHIPPHIVAITLLKMYTEKFEVFDNKKQVGDKNLPYELQNVTIDKDQ